MKPQIRIFSENWAYVTPKQVIEGRSKIAINPWNVISWKESDGQTQVHVKMNNGDMHYLACSMEDFTAWMQSWATDPS